MSARAAYPVAAQTAAEICEQAGLREKWPGIDDFVIDGRQRGQCAGVMPATHAAVAPTARAVGCAGVRSSGLLAIQLSMSESSACMIPPEAGADVAQATAPITIESLVRDYHALVWRTVKRLGVLEFDADDATQKVFMLLAERVTDIEPASCRSYVYGVALRVAANERRATKRHTQHIQLADDSGAVTRIAEQGPSPEAIAAKRQALGMLDQLLAELPESLREVYVLSEIEELAAPEVATLLDIPPGTVASRLKRAREDMRAGIARLRANHLARGNS